MKQILTTFIMGWDKVWHFSGCFLLTILFTFLFRNPLKAFLTVLVLGFLKEVYDYYSVHHICDMWDLIADSLGSLAAIIILYLYCFFR